MCMYMYNVFSVMIVIAGSRMVITLCLSLLHVMSTVQSIFLPNTTFIHSQIAHVHVCHCILMYLVDEILE